MAIATPNGLPERTPSNGIQNKLLDQVIRTPDRMPSPQPTHLAVPGAMVQRTLNDEGSGYVAQTFEGKEQQMNKVADEVDNKGFIPSEFVENEVKWFYDALGIDDMYFQTESVDAIVSSFLSGPSRRTTAGHSPHR